MKTISLKEALKIIDLKNSQGEHIPFAISFRTLNRNSKTGGALRTYTSVTFPKQKGEPTEKQKIAALQRAAKQRKNPNHFKNRTRNLQKANGEIFKVNIRLIVSINNQKVIY